MSNLPVVDRDEAHFAQASRQMLQTSHYFQVRFQDITRFQKPPGINWLQAASVKIVGYGDASVIWPYRIPSLLGALFSVLLTFFFARRFVAERVALLAAAFLASSLLLVVEAHMAVIDASLLSAVLLMQGALWVIYHAGIANQQAHWRWALIFWLAMAYGAVLKGVTPLVGVLTVVALCLVERRVVWLRRLYILPGLLLFLLLSVAWLLLLNDAEHSNYLMQMLHKDLLPKLQGGHESHGKPPLFHLLILPLTFWPASLFLWQGAVYAFNGRHQCVVRFLLAWIIPTWLFFEMMPTKLPQYVLPTFPAIALLCSMAITAESTLKKPSTWLRFLQVLWGVLSVGIAVGVSVLPYFLMQEVTLVSVMLLLSLSVMTIINVYFAYNGAYRYASIAVLFTALVSYPFIFAGLLPQLKPLWISRNIVQLIDKKHVSDTAPLLAVGYSEPSLVFYLNTKHVLYVNNALAQSLIHTKPSSLLLVDQNAYVQMMLDNPALIVVARTRGFNYNNGRWVELFLLQGTRGDKT